MKDNTILCSNPSIEHILRYIRDEDTPSNTFNSLIKLAGQIIIYEILKNKANTTETNIKTPLCNTTASIIKNKIIQIAILRAGLPFMEGANTFLDIANINRSIGIADAKRIEGKELKMTIEIGKIKVPPFEDNSIVVIYDPMLATGSTIISIIEHLVSNYGYDTKAINVASVISAPYGINNLHSHFKNISIYTLSIDDKGEYDGLNEKGFIVPGLGDCGDRAFNSAL